MAEAETSVNDQSLYPVPTKITKRCFKQTNKRKKQNERKEEEDIQNVGNNSVCEDQTEDNKCVKTNSLENDWKPIVFANKDESMLALQVVIEHVSGFEPDRRQHCLFLPHKLPLRNLTHTVLHKVGFRNLDKYTLEGRLQIGVLKPLPFNTVTDNLDDTIGHLLTSIISKVILYIKVKKMFEDSNEEERLEYREVPLLRGMGYLISDYFFVCDRHNERKDILYLRCRKVDCPSRAKIIRELEYAVIVNKNHNHSPPNVKMHEFMHRCRSESREPKNFTRQLKDVYDEICGDILSSCSSEEIVEVQEAIKDWDSVKKIMQKCRSRAVCATPRLEQENSEEGEQSDAPLTVPLPQDSSVLHSSHNNTVEKTKTLKVESHKPTDSEGLSKSQITNFTSIRDASIFQAIPAVSGSCLTPMIPGGISLPSGSGVPMMVHAGTVDSITSENIQVGPIPLSISASTIPHQGYTHYHLNSNWTTTPDNFMLNVQSSHTN